MISRVRRLLTSSVALQSVKHTAAAILVLASVAFSPGEVKAQTACDSFPRTREGNILQGICYARSGRASGSRQQINQACEQLIVCGGNNDLGDCHLARNICKGTADPLCDHSGFDVFNGPFFQNAACRAVQNRCAEGSNDDRAMCQEVQHLIPRGAAAAPPASLAAGPQRLRFNPAINGFRFRNDFHSHGGPVNTDGLCGGMVLAAFNFFRYNIAIPPYTNADIDFDVNFDLGLRTSGTNVLVDYIFQSQVATFTNVSALSFFGPADPDYKVEFLKVKARIDRGEYLILGLKMRGSGSGHQVLAYGYDSNGLKVFVYDPNTPGQETVIVPAMEGSRQVIELYAAGAVDRRYKAMFEQQELFVNRTSDRTTYDMVDNVLRGLNYAVRPPNVPPPAANVGFGYESAAINYEQLLPATDIYWIRQENGKAVEVEDGVFARGTKVQQFFPYERNGLVDGKNQRWLLIPAGRRGTQTVFYIINDGFLRFLQAGSDVTVQEGNQADSNQLWFLQPSGTPNKFYIKSVSTGTYIQAPPSAQDGQAPQLARYTGNPNQLFTFIHLAGATGVRGATAAAFTIKPASSDGMALDASASVMGNVQPVRLVGATVGNMNQQWHLVRGGDGFYELKPRVSDGRKCGEIARGSLDEGAQATTSDCVAVANQRWLVIPVEREQGKYLLFNKNSGRALTADAGVRQRKFVNRDNYKWRIIPAQ